MQISFIELKSIESAFVLLDSRLFSLFYFISFHFTLDCFILYLDAFIYLYCSLVLFYSYSFILRMFFF